MEELEKGEKGLGAESCSLGLADSDDINMTYWNGTILGPPHSTHENRIYSLSLEVGPEYPARPPVVKFLTKVNIPCVDQNTGVVSISTRNGVVKVVSMTDSRETKVMATRVWLLTKKNN